MKEYLQDKNAGNLGDYLKHFLLIKLIEKIVRSYPNSSIAYIESHAGAGVYRLQEEHRKNIDKYKKNVCTEYAQWNTFEKLNSEIEKNKVYYGSFVLAGKLFLENRNLFSKMVLYEYEKNNKEVFERMVSAIDSLLSELKPEPLYIESSPKIIKDKIKKLKDSGIDIVVCLVDPYFQEGKKDSIWCETLLWDDPGLFLLMFDFVRAQGKDEKERLRFLWHCKKRIHIKATNLGIKGYAIFGNRNSEIVLEEYRSIN